MSRAHATFMYMSETVGVGKLRQNLSKYLRRVERGERLVVTDRNRPVAELGPVSRAGALDRLIAEGKVAPPSRPPRDFQPIKLRGEGMTLSQALDEIRGDR
jgi:prevent-host-death family protein